jgi:NADH:ubiquinone oxidoreductase subunit F (NADH-binding)
LIQSIEGFRGEPVSETAISTTSGLWGKPTVINNVETYANLPAVFLDGENWFSSIGTGKSAGTKGFALAGKVRIPVWSKYRWEPRCGRLSTI